MLASNYSEVLKVHKIYNFVNSCRNVWCWREKFAAEA